MNSPNMAAEVVVEDDPSAAPLRVAGHAEHVRVEDLKALVPRSPDAVLLPRRGVQASVQEILENREARVYHGAEDESRHSGEPSDIDTKIEIVSVINFVTCTKEKVTDAEILC